jgi:hypothetical protein
MYKEEIEKAMSKLIKKIKFKENEKIEIDNKYNNEIKNLYSNYYTLNDVHVFGGR